MRQIRGYIDTPLSAGATIAIDERLGHHLTRVLRLEADARVVLFNGDGNDYPSVLGGGRQRLAARVESCLPGTPASPLVLTLAQGLCRGEKMDLILQKATELGVSAVQPLSTERSEVRLSGERESKRVAHWRQVLISACEQSGRSWVPELASPIPMSHWIGAPTLADSTRLMLDPTAELPIGQVPVTDKVVLAIGPEGGFSPKEREMLVRAGFVGARLGPRILRTETAGLTAISILQALHGDLR